MHYYRKHVKDYIADTSHLSLLEHGVYNILIDTYVLREQPIALDKEELYWSIAARTEEEKTAVDLILKHFFEETKKGYRHKRIEAEIQFCIDRSNIGKKGAKKRWDSKGNADPLVPSTQYPEPNTQYIELFEEFWKTYPHRNGNKKTKKDSMNWWQKQSLDTITIVLKAAKGYKKYIEKCHNDKVFDGGVPDPIRYLKNERYLDELDVKLTNSAFAGGHK